MNIKLINKIEVGACLLLVSTYVGIFSVHRPQRSDAVIDVIITRPSSIEYLLGDLAYLIIPCLVLLRWKQFLFVFTRDLFPILISLIAILSISWSAIPNISPVMGFVRSTIFAGYLATRFKRQDLMNLFACPLGIAAILSVFVVLFIPGYGIYGHGEWCGIFRHKNHLGRPMIFSSVIFFSLALRRYKYQRLLWTLFGISSCLVFLSRSGGAIINFVIVMSIIPFSKFIKKTQIEKQILIFNFGFTLCGFMLFLVITKAEYLLGLIGKDLTLTGRSTMWPLVIEYVKQKPFLGYGYASFWRSEYGADFRANYTWETIPHSHNGFFELLLGLGYVGLFLFIVGSLFAISRALYLTYLAKTVEDILPLQLLLAVLIAASSEANLLNSNSIPWIIYVAISLSLALENRYLKYPR